MSETPKNRGRIVNNLTEQSREEYATFKNGIDKKMKDGDFKKEIVELLKSLNTNFKYKESVTAVEDIFGILNELLVKLGFMTVLEKNNGMLNKNKPKITSFITERLKIIQLKPYKHGAALVVFIEKRSATNKHKSGNSEGVVKITIRPVAEEDGDGVLMGNKPKKNKKNTALDLDPFGKNVDKVRARKEKDRF